MNQTQLDSFELCFAPDFPEYERELLLTTISTIAGVTLQQPPDKRFIVVDDYIVIVGAVGVTAKAATEVIKLIKEFNSIIKDKGIESKAKLQSSEKKSPERSEQEPLELNNATEKEIQEWLEQHPSDQEK